MENYQFKNFEIKLFSGLRRSTGVSRSSYALSKVIPSLNNLEVLDLGCGIGYMSIGSIVMGAKRVVAVDIDDTEMIVRKNLKINGLTQHRLEFIRSDLFANIRKNRKFDVIIANLPQHALPASPASMMLSGKYGGYDGTDMVCRGLTEGAYHLKTGGRYYGSISELTNFRRTLSIARSIYSIRVLATDQKKMHSGEMLPFLKDSEVLNHLRNLKRAKLIKSIGRGLRMPIKYNVQRYEFTLKQHLGTKTGSAPAEPSPRSSRS